MYKIAIVGSENSHAINFAKLINGGHAMRGGRGIEGFNVFGAFGPDEIANERLKTQGGVEIIADSYDAFVDTADAVMVTARHGGFHLEYALPYIKRGLPMFIDKPITIDEDDAIELVRAAKKYNAPLCGGSCCKSVTQTKQLRAIAQNPPEYMGKIIGGSVMAPISLKNDYGDFFFYSPHLVEMGMEIFGHDIKKVFAEQVNESVTALVYYDDFHVSYHFGTANYSATLIGASKTLHREIDIYTDAYDREVSIFTEMVRSKTMPVDYEAFIKSVFVVSALKRSLDSGRPEEINKVII